MAKGSGGYERKDAKMDNETCGNNGDGYEWRSLKQCSSGDTIEWRSVKAVDSALIPIFRFSNEDFRRARPLNRPPFGTPY